MNAAARVGALVVVFGGLTYGALSFLGKGMFGAKTTPLSIEMEDATGVTAGTRLLMAGVTVGTVSKVELKSPTVARLLVDVKNEIPRGTVAVLPSSLTGLGDTYINLIPPATSAGALAAGEVIPGRKAKALDSFLPNGEKAVDEMVATMRAFRKLMEDGELIGSVKSLMTSMDKTIAEFGKTAQGVNGLMADNRLAIKKSMTEAAAMMTDVSAMTKEMAVYVKSGKFQGNIDEMMTTLNSTAKKADEMVASMNAIIGDPEFQASIKTSTKNVALMTDSGVKMAGSGEKMAVSGEKIAANMEVITSDGKEISKRTIELMDRLNEVMKKASEIEDQVKGAIDKVGGTLSKGAPNPLAGMTSRMDIMRETKPDYYRSDFTFTIPQKEGYLSLGVFDAFYSNRLTAQVGKPLDSNWGLRYGVFASRPGLGVDYRIGSTWSWRGDFWDINDPRFDFRFSHNFGKGVLGWVGMDRVFQQNAPTIGIGIVK